MAVLREHAGIEYLAMATRLLQRARLAHPTKGVWEAADLQWWWRKPRVTDSWKKPFLYDDQGPIAAAIPTDRGGRTGLDILSLPTSTTDLIEEVWARWLAMVAASNTVEVMVDDEDMVLARLLRAAGFERQPEKGVSAWMTRPAVETALPGGYSLVSRDRSRTRHHFVDRIGPEVEDRLRQTSLYRPDLDLTAIDRGGNVVAYGIFWYDPVTKVGFVEPMGTDEAHRRKGLARHVLTAGVDKLMRAGAHRILGPGPRCETVKWISAGCWGESGRALGTVSRLGPRAPTLIPRSHRGRSRRTSMDWSAGARRRLPPPPFPA